MFESITNILNNIISSGKVSNDLINLISYVIVCVFIGYAIYHFMRGLKVLFTPNTTNDIKKENIEELKIKIDIVNVNMQKTCDSIVENINLHLKDIKNIDNNIHVIINLLQQDIVEINNIQEGIKNINEQINDIKKMHTADAHIIAPIKTNIDNIMLQINSIQRDLSSLHGTIIGIATTRNSLK